MVKSDSAAAQQFLNLVGWCLRVQRLVTKNKALSKEVKKIDCFFSCLHIMFLLWLYYIWLLKIASLQLMMDIAL